MFNAAYRIFAVSIGVLAAGATDANAENAEATVAGMKLSLEFPCRTQKHNQVLTGGAKATIITCLDNNGRYSVIITDHPPAMKSLGAEALLEQYVTDFRYNKGLATMKVNNATKFLTYPARNTVERLNTKLPRQLKALHVVADGVTVSVMAYTSPEAGTSPKVAAYFASLKIEAAR